VQFLAAAGILPSHSQTYALADVEDALERAHGAPVTVHCRQGSLSEIWYHFNIAGSMQTGKFVSAPPGSSDLSKPMSKQSANILVDGQTSNCPRRGIRYPPKRSAPEPTKTTTRGPEPTQTGAPFSGKGNLMVSTLNQRRGCIISYGTWYASGTCATFRAKKASGQFCLFLCVTIVILYADPNFTDDTFTLKSSKGLCAFEDDALNCGSHVTRASEFTVRYKSQSCVL
jgi:ribonuclease T2